MESCFASCSAFTRTEEGGYVDDPRDSGNWTGGHVGQGVLVGSNMGVGAPALLAWMGPGARITTEQMRKLPLATYEAIARCKYWSPMGCGLLPAGLDLMVFDFGWNRGIRTSLDIVTRSLGVDQQQAGSRTSAGITTKTGGTPEQLLQGMTAANVRILQKALDLSADGIAGAQTVKGLEARQDLHLMAAILALSAAQVASYRQLANFPIYGTGWLARSARRQAAALAAARQSVPAAIQTGMVA
jgi:lysozyme family protein